MQVFEQFWHIFRNFAAALVIMQLIALAAIILMVVIEEHFTENGKEGGPTAGRRRNHTFCALTGEPCTFADDFPCDECTAAKKHFNNDGEEQGAEI